MRIRKSVQEMAHEDLILFNEAVRKMKELPKDDPRNFMQQAQIHCAYCNDAFGQVDFPKTSVQVHGSWLFLPWHRFYIYFWERILGKLVGRTDLAIPYWDWDSKTGMKMPLIYKETVGSLNYLYNPNRNADHLDALLDYKYINPNDTPKDPCNADPEPDDLPTYDVITNNQKQLYDLIQNGKRNPELFHGRPIREGQVRDSPGSMESLHTMRGLANSMCLSGTWVISTLLLGTPCSMVTMLILIACGTSTENKLAVLPRLDDGTVISKIMIGLTRPSYFRMRKTNWSSVR
ncbi:hypothetical protein IFM89_003823 [Coptis chinensis]|uniref:Tyrosinase copper-binding domain-containing protein n=1 Tax=Coptis chinensis TaxID=261450 RepID=A0A835HKR8_9MAGN|nr:hypothetical protein IFM89_003823 [Coptis chinensis]